LAIIFTTVALLLYAISLLTMQFSLGEFGFIASLSFSYWLALFFLFLASAFLWLGPNKNAWLPWIQVFSLITILWLTPVITGGFGAMPNLGPPLDYYGLADSIFRNGCFDARAQEYLNWPGSMILTAITENVTGPIDPALVTALTPFLMQIAFLLLIYIIAKNTLSSEKQNWWMAGIWLFELANWSPENKYSSQSYAAILLLLALMIMLRASRREDSRLAAKESLLIIIISACITITHFITGVFLVIFLCGLLITRRKMGVTLPVIGLVIMIAWAIYGAAYFLGNNLNNFIEMALRVDLLGISFLRSNLFSAVTSQAAVVVNRIQFIDTLLYFIIAGTGFIVSYKAWRQGKFDQSDKVMIVYTIAVLIGSSLSIYRYKFEIVYRTVWLILPVIAYFALKLTMRRNTAILLCASILTGIPLFLFSVYGGLPAVYTSPGDLAGRRFIINQVDAGQLVILVKGRGIGVPRFIERYIYYPYDPRYYISQYTEPSLWLANLERTDSPQYILLSATDEAFFKYALKKEYVGTAASTLDGTKEYSRIYSANGFSMYYR